MLTRFVLSMFISNDILFSIPSVFVEPDFRCSLPIPYLGHVREIAKQLNRIPVGFSDGQLNNQY